MSTTHHKVQIMAHFRKGLTLTDRESRRLFRKDRLAARIKDLRNDGHTIITTMEPNDNGWRHGRYSLQKDKPNG